MCTHIEISPLYMGFITLNCSHIQAASFYDCRGKLSLYRRCPRWPLKSELSCSQTLISKTAFLTVQATSLLCSSQSITVPVMQLVLLVSTQCANHSPFPTRWQLGAMFHDTEIYSLLPKEHQKRFLGKLDGLSVLKFWCTRWHMA